MKNRSLIVISIIALLSIFFSSCSLNFGNKGNTGTPTTVSAEPVASTEEPTEEGNTLYVRRYMPTPLETTTELTTEEPTTAEPTTKKPVPPTTEEPATVPTTTEKPTERETTTKRQEPTTRKQEPTTQWEPVTQHPARSDLREVVLEVIRGNYGNGAERKRRLEADGYDYEEVQNEVNRVMGYIEQEVD